MDFQKATRFDLKIYVFPSQGNILLHDFLSNGKDKFDQVDVSSNNSYDLKVDQMDANSAFPHKDINKEIYMEQPKGFKVERK